MNAKKAKHTISMTPRSSVEQNIAMKMPSTEQLDTKQVHDVSMKPSGDDDDGFNEFLEVVNSSGSSPAKPSESMTTVVS